MTKQLLIVAVILWAYHLGGIVEGIRGASYCGRELTQVRGAWNDYSNQMFFDGLLQGRDDAINALNTMLDTRDYTPNTYQMTGLHEDDQIIYELLN